MDTAEHWRIGEWLDWPPADEALQAILAPAIWQPTPQRVRQRLEGWAAGAARLVAAWQGECLVGVLVLEPSSLTPGTAPAVSILAIAVADDCRGRGIGRGLIATARTLWPGVYQAETDQEAQGFYAKAGFVTQAFTRSFCGSEITRWSCTLATDHKETAHE